MMLEGTRINARDALRIGLVHEAPSAAEFETSVQARADKLAAGAPLAQALIKKAVREGVGMENIEDALEVEMKGFVESAMSEDAVVGVLSFLSKQTPEFTGK
jgi:enoyl-CoA hydratase/carnithine racemase